MEQIGTIGLDIAKTVFQVHGIDEKGSVVVLRKLKRRRLLPLFAKLPPCLVGLEACASSHYWAREIEKLGHDVRMMPPRYVRPYVKRNKNDAADAGACLAKRFSGQDQCRVNRPDTWQLRPAVQNRTQPLTTRSRPHMARTSRAGASLLVTGSRGVKQTSYLGCPNTCF